MSVTCWTRKAEVTLLIHVFIQLILRYLLTIYYMPNTFQDTGDVAMDKISTFLLTFW